MLAVLLVACSSVSAWSYKEHIQFTRLAVMRILADPAAPRELKTWLAANTTLLSSIQAEREFLLTGRVGLAPDPAQLAGLSWWVCVPDLVANDKDAPPTEPFGVRELQLHFLDLEFFKPDQAKVEFREDLSMLPVISDVPRDRADTRFVRAGMLPFSIEHAQQNLARCIAEHKLSADPARPEDQDHAVRWAGYLLHYAQDNTQPQHATIDYKSHSMLPPMPKLPSIHSEVEWRLLDDEHQSFPELRAKYWTLFSAAINQVGDPATTNDLWLATLEVARASYHELPMIGRAARGALRTGAGDPRIDTAAFFEHAETVDGTPTTMLQVKAQQAALAVRRSERILRDTWARASQLHSPVLQQHPTSLPTAASPAR